MNFYGQMKHWVGLAVCMFSISISALADSTNTNSAKFVLDLQNDTRTIQITPEYKEAALRAILPLFSDFAHKLQLPVPYPLTRSDIVDFGMTPFQRKDTVVDTVFVVTRQGFSFSFFLGIVRGFSWPNSYSTTTINMHSVSNFFGTVKVTRKQAIQSARDTLKKIDVPLEDVFAEQEPQVEMPKWETNTIARYLIKWCDPRGGVNGSTTVRAEVNAETGKVESLNISPVNGLKRPAPKVSVIPPEGHDFFSDQIPPSMNPEYAWKLIPIMFKAIDEYAQKLQLPIPRPLTTNNVAKVEAYNNEGWPHCEIWLTNGWHFVYRHTMVCGYYAPDNFFDSDDRKIHIKDFEGKWNLTTNRAIEIIRQTIAKLAYPTNHIHINDATTFIHAAAVDEDRIPRLNFEWYYEPNDDLQSRLEAEVNMENGKLESLYYDDKAYWNSRPPIDVPISSRK